MSHEAASQVTNANHRIISAAINTWRDKHLALEPRLAQAGEQARQKALAVMAMRFDPSRFDH